ncbi:hypothetical protein I2I11_02845 [Pontibacter sp. 172403-2]|uniref:zinc-ribbon domain-containing protein n=1 Tax=Pontibacter rufus TaxID=2791028 RepID=UPI0018AFDE58|nr:zinc-ribbon domain-containing protein [Pontibacter sp. 172403-2]MBF9252222.1 hypothetical protein [Pontibacter sp. 172403-2]
MQIALHEMQHLAHERGGKCLSDTYVNSKSRLWWECGKGHTWQATPFSVKTRKSWCPACANNRPLGLEKMQELAKAKGGKCLSDAYTNCKVALQWECRKGHSFMTTPDMIVQGSWCPQCK